MKNCALKDCSLKNCLQKKLTIILFTLIIIIVFSQYGSGILIEKYYRKSLSHPSEELKLKAVLKDFKRGLFTSTALIEINVPTNSDDSNDSKNKFNIILIQQKIIHGPFVIDFKYKKFPINIALAHIYNELSDQLKSQLVELFHNDKPFTVITKLGFFGNGITIFSGVPIKQSTKTKFEVIWNGITGKINHSLDLSTMKGEAIAQKLSLKDPEYKLSINNIRFNFDIKENNNLSIGDSNIHIDKLIYMEQNQALFKLVNLNIKSVLNNDKDEQQKLRYLLKISTENSKILKQTFTENSYSLIAQSINPEFFDILHTNYNKKLALLDDLLRQLLSSQAKVDLILPKYFSQSLVAFGNFQLYKNSILGKIDPRSKDQILAEIFNTINAKFDSLVASKIFIDNKNEQYQLHVKFIKDGRVLLNGEPLQNPFQALQGLGQTQKTEQTNSNEENACKAK